MTGAGSATVAFAKEDEYGDPADPVEDTWYQPGIDITAGDLSVDQALERVRHPHDPRPAGSRARNFEGAASVSFTLTDDTFHELVFADSGTALPSGPMHAPSSTWYFAVELPDGTVEPWGATGTIVPEVSWQYQQGEDIQVELTMLFGDVEDDIDTPDQIERPSKSEVYSWHGTTLKVDGFGQSLLQSASLSLSGLARFRRGTSRHPFDAVVDAIEPSLSTDATFTERDQLKLAVDDVDDDPDEVDATLEFGNGLGETIGYDLSGVKPTSYAWSDLVAPDTDLAEPIEYHVSHVAVMEAE